MGFTGLVRSSVLAFVAIAAACGEASDATSPATDPRSAASAAEAPSSSSNSTELTSERLTAYERGMRREIEAVRAAQKRSSDAKTAQERGEAIQASFEHATLPLGAEAAGLSVEQYRGVRETVNEIFRTLDIQGKIDGPISMDLSRVDEATRARLARDPFAELSPASADVLRQEMQRLVPLWIEYTNLTAVAG